MRWLFSLLVVFLLFRPIAVFAQSDSSQSAGFVPTPTPPITYTLPFPGILPDNPLYPLKMLRDRIVLFLIADPVKRARFNLLQADKRLQAGLYLYRHDKKKAALALSTMEKGANYFGQALSQTRDLKRTKVDITDLTNTLENAARKHEQILTQFIPTLPHDKQAEGRTLLKTMQDYQKQVDGLILNR
jgi:hypothetical protein